MVLLGNFLAFFLGLMLTGIPLFVSVARMPSQIGDVMSIAALTPHYAEIIFIGISVGAIALIETSQNLFGSARQRELGRVVVWLLGMVIMVEIIVAAIWYGSAVELRSVGSIASKADVVGVLILDVIVVIEALILRTVMWSK